MSSDTRETSLGTTTGERNLYRWGPVPHTKISMLQVRRLLTPEQVLTRWTSDAVFGERPPTEVARFTEPVIATLVCPETGLRRALIIQAGTPLFKDD
jgi:hypothetical protein